MWSKLYCTHLRNALVLEYISSFVLKSAGCFDFCFFIVHQRHCTVFLPIPYVLLCFFFFPPSNSTSRMSMLSQQRYNLWHNYVHALINSIVITYFQPVMSCFPWRNYFNKKKKEKSVLKCIYSLPFELVCLHNFMFSSAILVCELELFLSLSQVNGPRYFVPEPESPEGLWASEPLDHDFLTGQGSTERGKATLKLLSSGAVPAGLSVSSRARLFSCVEGRTKAKWCHAFCCVTSRLGEKNLLPSVVLGVGTWESIVCLVLAMVTARVGVKKKKYTMSSVASGVGLWKSIACLVVMQRAGLGECIACHWVSSR